MCMCIGMVFAYDFSYTYQGKTLYYAINGNEVSVTNPVNSGYYSYVSGDVDIPSTVDNNGTTYTVTVIDWYAFNQCAALTSVIIPNTVRLIQGGAFQSCVGLNSVTIPNSVTQIQSYAFDGCTSLSSVAIPNSVTLIGTEAFQNCTALTTIVLPDSLIYLDWGAFRNSGLTAVTIPASVNQIGNAVFSGCNNLTSIVVAAGNTHYDSRNNCNAIIQTDLNILVQGCNATIIPNEVRVIGSYAFQGFNGFSSITIPDSVVSIGDYAFSNCSELISLTIGESVAGIGDHAFNGGALTSLHCKPVTPPILTGNYQFTINSWYDELYRLHYNFECFIPCGSNASYQAAQGWSSMSDFFRNEGVYTVSVIAAGHGTVNVTQASCSNLQATLTATPASGYSFSQWSDGNTNNPRTMSLTQDTNLIAYFVANASTCPPVTTFPWNNTFDANLTCWDAIDADGDGHNWSHYQGYAVSESFAYFDGSQEGLTPDNWLISKEIVLPENSNCKLSWNAQGLNDTYYNEHYSVYLSTGDNMIGDFTTELFSETLNSNNVNRNVSLQNYRGQTIRIAFRHHNTDDVFVFAVGNIKIVNSAQGIDDVTDGSAIVYAIDGRIVVENDMMEDVIVYDIVGKMVDNGRKNQFTVPSSGVYLVKVGDAPARKVAVVK